MKGSSSKPLSILVCVAACIMLALCLLLIIVKFSHDKPQTSTVAYEMADQYETIKSNSNYEAVDLSSEGLKMFYKEAQQEVIAEKHFWKLNSQESAPYVGYNHNYSVYVDATTKALYILIPYRLNGESMFPIVKDPDLGSFYKYEGDVWEIESLKEAVQEIYSRKLKAAEKKLRS